MPLTVRSRLQGSQPVGNLLNACGVQRRSVRYRGCWTPPPAACQTPRRPSPKAPSMGADLDRTSACARTMLGIFEPECRVPGLRQSAAALLRQIAWASLSGRVTAEALPRCFGGVRRAGKVLRPLRSPGGPRSGGVRARGSPPEPPCRARGGARWPSRRMPGRATPRGGGTWLKREPSVERTSPPTQQHVPANCRATAQYWACQSQIIVERLVKSPRPG